MATGLGLTVGSVHAVAAPVGTANATLVGTADAASAGTADATPVVVPAALTLDGADAALVTTLSPAQVVVSGFAARVGDPVGLIADDGSTHTGEDLVAATMRCLVEYLPPADAVVAAHPAAWSRYQADALTDALSRAGLPDVELVTEPQAAVAWWQRTRSGVDDAPVVVYDLGAGSLEVTVVRPPADPDDPALPEILGAPIRSEEYSGSGFDHATTSYVLDQLAGSVGSLDPFEPETVSALAELRARCREAKEALSADTATVVAVDLPGVRCDVRLVREELENLIREPLADSVTLVEEAIRGAGLDVSDIGAILLIGGSSAIPLVTELLSATLRLPVVSGPDPVTTAAAGAALLAVDVAAASPAATIVDTDTAAMTAVGTVLSKPVPAPAAPPLAEHSRRNGRTGGMSTPRKAALITAAAAAIALLTAGGLSVGTGAFSPTESRSDAATTTATPTPAVAEGTTPTSAAGTAVPVGVSTDGSSSTGTAGTGNSNGGATQSNTTTSGGTAPAAGQTQQGAPATADNSGGTSTGGTPATGGTDTTGGGTTGGTTGGGTTGGGTTGGGTTGGGTTGGGTGTGVGTQVGNAATGVGQGLGNVVGGVGQGVGGVLSGTGQLVGGVVDGTTGLVGGLLGQ